MAGNTIHVQGSYIDVHDNENVYLSVDKAEVKMRQAPVGPKEQRAMEQQPEQPKEQPKEQPEQPKEQPEQQPLEQQPGTRCAAPAAGFAERVKAIMRKAATKNGQMVASNARGHAREYRFYVDAEAFCKAMDEMAAVYPDRLRVMLGGSLATVQVTKVCTFIGHVIRMQEINDECLQAVDLLFAFEDYYDNRQTVRARLGDGRKTDDQAVVLGTFQGLLKKYKS
ncbi:MAG: hypothetical protein J6M41_03445 [Prevotella sp.]|nr:hypothetical protein [Prevotella sp.]MBP3789604.1 hypothetical protein [Prevotella sp.]